MARSYTAPFEWHKHVLPSGKMVIGTLDTYLDGPRSNTTACVRRSILYRSLFASMKSEPGLSFFAASKGRTPLDAQLPWVSIWLAITFPGGVIDLQPECPLWVKSGQSPRVSPMSALRQ